MAKNTELQGIISRHVQGSATVEDSSEKIMEIPLDWKDQNVPYKRDLLMDIVTKKGTVKPSWGDDSRKPLWWPSNLHFVSPKNNRSQHRPKLADLNEIIQSFIDSRAQLASFEEMDIEVCETEEEVGELLEMEVGEERNSRTDQNEEQISELEGICDLIKPVIASDDMKTILAVMSHMEWHLIEKVASLLLPLVSNALQTALPHSKCPITARHIQIWSRHHIPNCLEGFEPVYLKNGPDSLFRAASFVAYQDEKYWTLLKIGSLAKAITESSMYESELVSMINAPNVSWVDIFREEVFNVLMDIHSGAGNHSRARFVLELASLSRLLAITFNVYFSNGDSKISIFSSQSEKVLNFISIDESQPYNVLALVKLENECPLDSRARCDAGVRCLVPVAEGPIIKCRNCMYTYHSACVGKCTDTNDCGCSTIEEGGERLNVFKTLRLFRLLFDTHESQLKELVEGLFCGTVPTCRHVRNARIRDELNCFCAEIPFDVDSYVIGRIEEWMEKGLVQVPVDKHYVAGFFCDVVIREAMMYLIIKETGMNRISAERVARRFLAPHFPDRDVWLHDPAYK